MLAELRCVTLACGCRQTFRQRSNGTIKLGVRNACAIEHTGPAYRAAFADALKRAGLRPPRRGSARP